MLEYNFQHNLRNIRKNLKCIANIAKSYKILSKINGVNVFASEQTQFSNMY